MIDAFSRLLGVDKDVAEAMVLTFFGIVSIRADMLLGHIARSLDKLIVLCAPKIVPPKHNHEHTIMMAHPINERER